jgi:hypothetical protein
MAGLISEPVGRGPVALLLRIDRTVGHSRATTAGPSPTRPVWFSLPRKGRTAASQPPTVAEHANDRDEVRTVEWTKVGSPKFRESKVPRNADRYA